MIPTYEEILEVDRNKAFTMYTILQKSGKIEKEHVLYKEYARPVMQKLLDEFSQLADTIIYQLDGIIYMSPGIDNGLIGLSNEEARKLFKVKDNKELYLCYFTVIVLVACFYNSDYQADAGRNFLLVSQLEEIISKHMNEINEMDTDVLDTIISEDGIQYREIYKIWDDKKVFDSTLTELKMSNGNHISFLLKHPLAALEKEELIIVTDNSSIIRLLPKMKHLIEGVFFDLRRKEKLVRLIGKENKEEILS